MLKPGQKQTYDLLKKTDPEAAENYKKFCLKPIKLDSPKPKGQSRICQLNSCGKEFYRNYNETVGRFELRKYCSTTCRHKAKATFKGKIIIR